MPIIPFQPKENTVQQEPTDGRLPETGQVQFRKEKTVVVKILTGSRAGEQLTFPAGKSLSFGRDPAYCQVAAEDYPRVSRLHCTAEFDPQEGCFYVTDHSLNGTCLFYKTKNHPVVRVLKKGHRTAVQPGSVILLADETCAMELNIK